VKDSEAIKIYNIDNEFYLNCSENVGFSTLSLKEHNDPLSIIFGEELHSDIDFYEDYGLFNTNFFRFLSVKRLPRVLDTSMFQDISDYVVFARKVSSLAAKEKLNFKRKFHFGHLFKEIKSIESEHAYSEAEKLLEDISTLDEALYELEIYFLVKADSKENLDEKTKEVLKSLQELDCECLIESRAGASIFNWSLPGVGALGLRKFLAPASVLVNLLPLKRDVVHKEGVELYSRRGFEVRFNLFDKRSHNYNALITGSTGQGKSVLANKLLCHELNRGSSAVILDLGNSFLKTAKYFGAEILSNQINPLEFKDPVYLREFILSFMDGAMSFKEQGRLLKLIKNRVDGYSSFKEFILSLEDEFNGLSLYFEDIWHFFTDKKSCSSKLTYCDLSEYPERLKAPIIIYLIERFKNQSGKRVFIFDECWGLLLKNSAYLAECFRTFRKHGASAIAISQNIDDFLETPLGKVIIQNTFYKFLFRQSIIDKNFISSEQKELIRDLCSVKGEYSEFLLLSEEIKKPLRYYPSVLEYELFSSDLSDNESFNSYFEEKGRFIGFKKAIENYVEIKYV
jgi:type IV secretory pathway VirB4 component